jgi:threonyl-tRNA synthetase
VFQPIPGARLSNIKVTLPNNSVLEVESGSTILDVVKKIGPGLAKSAIAAYYNGKELDLSRKVTEDGQLRVLTHQNPEALEIVRHSTAHLMAMAVTELFPGTLLTIGPVIDSGFYYDFDSTHKFSPEDFPAIEEKMRELSKKDFPVERSEMARMDAIACPTRSS